MAAKNKGKDIKQMRAMEMMVPNDGPKDVESGGSNK